MLVAMRFAILVAVLAGCAHGNGNGNSDAGSDGAIPDGGGTDTAMPDAPDVDDPRSCGGLSCDSLRAIYVAPSGGDTAAGTRDAPLQTIAAGIAKAGAAAPPQAVFVQA